MAIKKAPRKDPRSGSAKNGKAPARKATPQKAAPKKAAAKKAVQKPAPKKALKKAAPKKALKQAASKKAAPKKAAVKPSAVKKPAPKKAPPVKAQKPAPKPVKKPVAAKPGPAKAIATKAAPKKQARPGAEHPAKPAERGVSKLAAQASAAKQAAHKFIVEIDRPTGMYNGVLLSDAPKQFPRHTPYSRKEIEKLGEALRDERQRLVHELNSLQGVSRSVMDETREHPGYSQHMAEHATDLQTAEASLGLRTIEQERLELVDEALERIQRNINHYGLCLACGSKIGIQRLIARPHAHLCMDCRQRYEKVRARRGL